jgi:hypothetical protein
MVIGAKCAKIVLECAPLLILDDLLHLRLYRGAILGKLYTDVFFPLYAWNVDPEYDLQLGLLDLG